MKNASIFFPTLFFVFLFSQCVTPYESARMLPKGNTEIKASYSHARIAAEGENEKLNDGFGLGLGYGFSDKFNFKVRYERLSSDGDINFVAFGPKVGLIKDRIAVALPFWAYFAEGESTWGVSPTMLFGILPPSKTFETNVGIRGDFSFEENNEALLGINLGFGLSKDLDRWAIRPDLGLTFNPGEKGMFLTFGLGAQYIIAPKTKN